MRFWTRDNLQSGDVNLPSAWKWGQHEDGSWSDSNPASDADQWMAYALLLAAERWNEPDYRRQAKGLLNLTDLETLELKGKRWLFPGPWAATDLQKGGPLRLNLLFCPLPGGPLSGGSRSRLGGNDCGSLRALGATDGDRYALPDWLFLIQKR